MKRKDILKLSQEDAQGKMNELYAEYMEFRFRKSMGTAKMAPLYGRILRRNIARLKTIINEFQKGGIRK